MRKKGQITLFVIIGIVILIAAGAFFTLRSISSESSDGTINRIAETPVEFQPINDFIESCIAKTSKEGIQQLGLHGGYIDLNKYGIQPESTNPTEGRAFLFNPVDTKGGIVYWNYFTSNNLCQANCECGSEKPYLYKKEGSPNLETQLEDYIDENLEICLQEFQAFESQGFIIDTPNPVISQVNIRNDDVLIYVNYRVEVEKDRSDYTIEEFLKSSPVQLRKMYMMAEEITQRELNYSYLEKWTIEQISGFGLGLDHNKIPPIAASELSPGEAPVYWIKKKVEQDIMNNMLPQYTPFLTVYDSANYKSNLYGTFYERATIPLQNPNSEYYGDMEVDFTYFNWWPVHFDLTGRGVSGERIGPETASSSYLSFIGIKRYNFYYDLSYPVLVDIYDSEAFNQEGFHFYVGLETNVRNNKALNCSGAGITQYSSPSGSLFCNQNQGCSEIEIETIDAKTQEPLEDVAIYYSSGSESCNKGFTELDVNKASLKAKLPQCVGEACSLNAIKDDYWYYPQSYAVLCNKIGGTCSNNNILCNQETLQINMEPFRHNPVIIMKKKLLKQARNNWQLNNVAENLLSNEYAVMTLTKIKEHENEATLSLTGIFYGNESEMTIEPGFVPGQYELRIDLFYDFPDQRSRDHVTFQAVEECEDTYFGLDEECVTIGPYNFTDTFMEGGVVSNITITKEMLDEHEKLVFYTLSIPDIDTSYNVLDVYDLEQIGTMNNRSAQYVVELKPSVI